MKPEAPGLTSRRVVPYNVTRIRLVSDHWCMAANVEDSAFGFGCPVSLISDLWQLLSLSCFFRPLILLRYTSQVFCMTSPPPFLMFPYGETGVMSFWKEFHRTEVPFEVLFLRAHAAFMTSHWWRWPTWLRCCTQGLFAILTFSPFRPLFFGSRSLEPAHNKPEENQAPPPRREIPERCQDDASLSSVYPPTYLFWPGLTDIHLIL